MARVPVQFPSESNIIFTFAHITNVLLDSPNAIRYFSSLCLVCAEAHARAPAEAAVQYLAKASSFATQAQAPTGL